MKLKNVDSPFTREEKTTDQLADEIVEILLDSIASKGNPKNARERVTNLNSLERKDLMEIVKLKNRIAALENRVEKYIRSFQITATESERHLTEKSEELTKENQQDIMNLQAQIEDLRTAMVRLGNEVKKLKS